MTELKPGWRRVKFGDVVRLSKARSANPEAEGIERYVGLEHIDPQDLQIRRWGWVAEGTTFTTHFKPGQVLFGKRRAYQRKVAVADFEGVCSGDIYVFESADPSVLLPELLPFICQTERFFEYAVGTSAGSLSPRTNWNSLAKFEVDLPSYKEQQKTVEILESLEKLVQSYSITEAIGHITLRASLFNLLSKEETAKSNKTIAKEWEFTHLEEILETVIDYRGKTPKKSPSGIPLITAKNVRDGFISLEPAEFIAEDAYDIWMTRGIPKLGDVFFTMEAPLGYVAPVPEYRFALAQRLVVLRPNTSKITSRFLYWLMRSPFVQREVSKCATGTTAQGIKQSNLRRIPVFLPSLNQQKRITKVLDSNLSMVKTISNRLNEIRSFKTCALSQLL